MMVLEHEVDIRLKVWSHEFTKILHREIRSHFFLLKNLVNYFLSIKHLLGGVCQELFDVATIEHFNGLKIWPHFRTKIEENIKFV